MPPGNNNPSFERGPLGVPISPGNSKPFVSSCPTVAGVPVTAANGSCSPLFFLCFCARWSASKTLAITSTRFGALFVRIDKCERGFFAWNRGGGLRQVNFTVGLGQFAIVSAAFAAAWFGFFEPALFDL